ncbi:MAG TPA: hypothetical protein VFW15_10340 [Thermoanaerobaculia bacterium]|nr:hypothetical protein [Thermoanaerobaculia bacterium]
MALSRRTSKYGNRAQTRNCRKERSRFAAETAGAASFTGRNSSVNRTSDRGVQRSSPNRYPPGCSTTTIRRVGTSGTGETRTRPGGSSPAPNAARRTIVRPMKLDAIMTATYATTAPSATRAGPSGCRMFRLRHRREKTIPKASASQTHGSTMKSVSP